MTEFHSLAESEIVLESVVRDHRHRRSEAGFQIQIGVVVEKRIEDLRGHSVGSGVRDEDGIEIGRIGHQRNTKDAVGMRSRNALDLVWSRFSRTRIRRTATDRDDECDSTYKRHSIDDGIQHPKCSSDLLDTNTWRHPIASRCRHSIRIDSPVRVHLAGGRSCPLSRGATTSSAVKPCHEKMF